MPSVDIAERKGDAADFVHAGIGEDGRVLMVRNSFGPGDYETEVTAAVDAKDKDRLLLALLEERFRGNTEAVEVFRDWARSKGIQVAWFRWP